jgi:hypothetical protein
MYKITFKISFYHQWATNKNSLNRIGREADHSHPTSAEVKKMWIYTSTPLYVFYMA